MAIVKFVIVGFVSWLHKCIIANINLRSKGEEKGHVGQFLMLPGVIAIEDC